jgi:hypothetical protein
MRVSRGKRHGVGVTDEEETEEVAAVKGLLWGRRLIG